MIAGCTVSKSWYRGKERDACRWKVLHQGAALRCPGAVNCASIANNNSGAAKTCYVFLWIDQNGIIRCDATDLDQAVPDYGVTLYEVTGAWPTITT